MNRRDVIMTSAAGIAATVVASGAARAEIEVFPTYTVSYQPETDYATRLHTWVIEQELEGKHDDVFMSREAYKHLRLHNQIDWQIVDIGAPQVTAPFFAGHRVKVPGSALA